MTDGQTDRQTHDDSIYRARIESRVKDIVKSRSCNSHKIDECYSRSLTLPMHAARRRIISKCHVRNQLQQTAKCCEFVIAVSNGVYDARLYPRNFFALFAYVALLIF